MRITGGYGDSALNCAAYGANGQLQTLTDAEVNKTTYEYDGHDRLSKTRYPLPTQGANASSTTDFEQLTYDAASNVTSRQLRGTPVTTIAFTYDNLNRVTLKDLPGTEPDVTTAYDNLGRLTSATQTGSALSFTYDALSRNLTQAGPQGTVSSQWDLAGRRTRLTYPGAGLYIDQDYLVTGETTKLRENGATSGIGVLATLAYDDLGRRASLTRGNGTVTTYGFDLVSRLASLAENLTGTTNDQTATFAYNPASQIASMSKTNDIYAWTGTGSGTTASVANGLNQLTSIAGAATAHDSKGNLTSDPTAGKSYTYSSENLLKTSSGGTAASLTYDPSMRLAEITGAATTKFQYDGLALIAEYDAVGALTKRYVHGPGVDEPLIEYDGSGTTTKRWLHADERGSIIAISDAAGNVTTINRYDEYGKPQGTNLGRFQYTGQTWLPELGAYYYKARIYVPQLGRFLQTDPIGFAGGINWYAYAGNDPLNSIDALGLQDGPVIVVTGRRGPKRSGGLGGNGLAAFQAASAPTPIQLMPPRQTKEITACEANFAGAAIDKTGKSYSIPEVEFRSGLDNQANWLTEQAYSKPGVRAVTQGDVVYVNPKHWSDVTNPEKTTFWEEIVHSSQFVTIGYYKFYVAYGEASLTAVLRGGDDYFDNSLEKEAQELARELSQSYRKSKPCVR